MKAKSIIATSLMAAFAFLSTACSKDYSKDVAGSYTGDIAIGITTSDGYRDLDPVTDCTITISSQDENTVSITIPTIEPNERMVLSSFTIDGVAVEKSGNAYILNKGNYSVTANDYPVTGTANGQVANSRLNLDFTANVGPHELKFAFKTK